MATPQNNGGDLDFSNAFVPKASVPPASPNLDFSNSFVPKTATPPPAGTPTMQAAQPTIWGRIKSAITAGIPAFNSDFEVASHTDDGKLSDGSKPSMQLVTPQAGMTAQEKQNNPVLTGVAETAGGLTTPGSVATLAATGGFGELSAAGKAIIPRLISAGFSAQALKGAYDQIPTYHDAIDSGDEAEAHRILTHIVLDSGMGILAGRHAATGGPAISDTASNIIDGGSAALKGASKAGKYLTPAEIRNNFKLKEETPQAQHGTPVRTEQPLDGPTVGNKLGGKDLSQEALNTLQGHVGKTIPVGSSPKNTLMRAVEPVSKAISETASKMNAVVQKAPKFTTSVMQDNVFGEGTFTDEIDGIKKSLPPSVSKALGKDVDGVMRDADEALNSQNPAEVLEQRRQLGKKIDWDDIQKNPSTPAEVQNLVRVKIYQALGNKIHGEIPDTIDLDKTLQPNLELRAHMKSKLGKRVVEDPIAATAEHQSEFKKGKTTIENAAHNDRVTVNRNVLGAALKGAAGAVGAGGVYGAYEVLKNLVP